MCDDYQTAGTTDVPVGRLVELNLENPSHWDHYLNKTKKREGSDG